MVPLGIMIVAGAIFFGFFTCILFSIHLMFDKPFNQLYNLISWQTIKVIGASIAVSYSINVVSYFQSSKMFTSVIYGLEGKAVAVFQNFTNPFLTVFFIFVYLVVYFTFLFLTYLKLHSLKGKPELDYVGSYVLALLFSAPFFYFVPVEVTGYYLDSIQPIIYQFHPFLHIFLTSFDPLTKALPSLHTGLSFLAFIYSFKYTEGFKWYAGATTLAIVISTFYLGIHWISDAIIGVLIAFLSFYVVDRNIVTSRFVPGRIKSFVKAKLDSVGLIELSEY